MLEWKPLGHSEAVQMVFTSALYIRKIFVKCCTYVFVMSNALIKPTSISFAFHYYHNYFMAFLVSF